MDATLKRPRPSAWQNFFRSSLLFLARKLYSPRRVAPCQSILDPITVVCVSDTHDSQPSLPDGDVLVHAVDLTQCADLAPLQVALDWLKAQPRPHKIVVAKNHDLSLDTNCGGSGSEQLLDWGDVEYLENETTTITCANGRSLRVYGSPLLCKHVRLGRT